MHENALLFNLPFEVRERIYDFYLSVGYFDFHDTLRPGHTYLESGEAEAATTTAPAATLPPLMLACKALYRELHGRVRGVAYMRVHKLGQYSDRRIGFAVPGGAPLRLASLHTLYLLVAMEHPNWNGWLGFFGEVLRRHARGLTTLVVDWKPRVVGGGASWSAKMHRKKEDELLRTVAEAPSLQLLKLYGDVPKRWTDYLEENSGLRIVSYPFSWWVEPGMASI
ncbi:hypothetical protein F5X96DRAFT_124505 [Biscogniauxia mediterranea]|nr:hypothetical protein F5X96DRAFT_124505 [Biscogniauxia mediterranea]